MENASPQNTLKLTDLKPKMKLTGKVTKIELFGAFVDVGLETLGLIHISKLQRGQVNKVEDVVKEGEEIDVWVDKVTPDKDRLELTLIRPIQLSWNDIKPGLKKKGTVVRLETFGAFVDIGAERAGLVHVSEMSSEYISDPKELIKQGDEIDVIVLDVDRKKRQIKLSIKAAEEAELRRQWKALYVNHLILPRKRIPKWNPKKRRNRVQGTNWRTFSHGLFENA
jgi:ribosomal protein S1